MNPNFSLSMTSRYFGVEVAKYVTPDGVEIAYLRRRFIPLPDRYSTIGVHNVIAHERPDLIAFQHIGDAEQFWRIADPNAVLRPEELTETVGRSLRITLAEGIPVASNA
jgi:hypothetical protein